MKTKIVKDRKFIKKQPCDNCGGESIAIHKTRYYCKNCYNRLKYEIGKRNNKISYKRRMGVKND